MPLLIDQFSEARPEGAAVIDDRGVTTWSMLASRVDRLIHALAARGLSSGSTVAVFAGNQSEAIEVMLACMHSGYLVVPVNWHWVAAELAYVLEDAGAEAIVVADPWIDVAVDALSRCDDIAVRIAVTDRAVDGFERYEEVIAEGAAPGVQPPQHETVFGGPMFYTSGTTGFPKGVRSSLGRTGGPTEMWQLIGASIASTFDVQGPDAVTLLCGPIYHSAQWVFAFSSLLGGATVVLHHRFDASRLLDDVDRLGVTNLHLVPAQMVRLLRLDDDTRTSFSGSTLRSVFHGAAPCPESVKRSMIDWWGPVVSEYYGGTEGGFITTISAEEWLAHPRSVGRATAIIEVCVLSEDGEELPRGEPGDVCFRSLVGSDFEYHGAPDKTAGAHRGAGFGTLGDIGWMDDEGYLHLSDRRIDMIISGGVNIYPAEIESVLSSHSAVADVAVFGIPDDEMGEKVMAVVEPADGLEVDDRVINELAELCRSQLAGYKCPRVWDSVDKLPRSEAGKLVKRELRDPYWTSAHRSI